MTKYDIGILNADSLLEWIKQQSGSLSDPVVSAGGKKIICEFDHDSQQEKDFKKQLASRILTVDDVSVVDSLLKYIKEIQTDGLFLNWQIQMTLTNIGTTYKDIYPAAFDGLPLGLDTSGYTKLGIVVAWGKNSGTGRHDLRIVNNADDTQVLVHSEGISGGMVTGTRRHYDIDIPAQFENFRGEVKLQAKSTVETDNPIFYGLWGYLIR